MNSWYVFPLLVLAGMLFTNAVPHLVAGLSGEPFPSPFAHPRGVGDSSPTVNVYWGFANLAGGLALLARFWPAGIVGWVMLGIGSLSMGTHASRHFGRVRAAK